MPTLKSRLRRHRGPFTPGLLTGVMVGAGIHIAGLVWLGSTWRFPAPPAAEPAYVTTAADTQRNRDFAELLDPSPLFLPTKLNHGSGAAHDSAKKPEIAPLPDVIEAVGTLPASLATPRATPASLTAAGVTGAEIADTFATMGLRRPAAMAAGRARCVLTNEATGAQVPAPDLAVAADERDLRPAEFMVLVDAYGAQSPTLLHGTGDTTRDRDLLTALTAALQKRMPAPGRYHAVVAP